MTRKQLFETLRKIRGNAEDWWELENDPENNLEKGEGLGNIIEQLNELIVDVAKTAEIV